MPCLKKAPDNVQLMRQTLGWRISVEEKNSHSANRRRSRCGGLGFHRYECFLDGGVENGATAESLGGKYIGTISPVLTAVNAYIYITSRN